MAVRPDQAAVADGQPGDRLPAPARWRRRAACSGTRLDLFFTPDPAACGRALTICRGCEVRAECLSDALRTGDCYGVRGSLTRADRACLRPGGSRRRHRRAALVLVRCMAGRDEAVASAVAAALDSAGELDAVLPWVWLLEEARAGQRAVLASGLRDLIAVLADAMRDGPRPPAGLVPVVRVRGQRGADLDEVIRLLASVMEETADAA